MNVLTGNLALCTTSLLTTNVVNESNNTQYVGPERCIAEKPEVVLRSITRPFGDDVGPVATAEAFKAIEVGRRAERWLAMLERGEINKLKKALEEAVEIGYAWEDLGGINLSQRSK